MVIAVVSFAIALDLSRRRVGTGIGSAAPTPIEAGDATAYLEYELARHGYWEEPRANLYRRKQDQPPPERGYRRKWTKDNGFVGRLMRRVVVWGWGCDCCLAFGG